MDDASKINNQLMKMIVMFFSKYDTRCFVKTLNLNYFQNNEKQSSMSYVKSTKSVYKCPKLL